MWDFVFSFCWLEFICNMTVDKFPLLVIPLVLQNDHNMIHYFLGKLIMTWFKHLIENKYSRISELSRQITIIYVFSRQNWSQNAFLTKKTYVWTHVLHSFHIHLHQPRSWTINTVLKIILAVMWSCVLTLHCGYSLRTSFLPGLLTSSPQGCAFKTTSLTDWISFGVS